MFLESTVVKFEKGIMRQMDCIRIKAEMLGYDLV